MKKIIVIGNGSMAVDCLRIMRANPQAHVSLVIADPKDFSLMFLKHFCKVEGIDLKLSSNVNSHEITHKFQAIAPDFIFNINSFQIIREPLITIPKEAIINFHNGPLPRYRGMNVCSWAILNGEKKYGVTWHIVEKGVDSGDIVAQKVFDISESETAYTLIIRCIREGVALFEDLFPALLQGKMERKVQEEALATRYTTKDVPNNGFVDYSWTFDKFDSFVRGLTFNSFPNSFTHPKSIVNSRHFYIRKMSKYEGPTLEKVKPGTVLRLGKNGLDVMINNSTITITEILCGDLKRIRIADFIEKYDIRVGDKMGPCGAMKSFQS